MVLLRATGGGKGVGVELGHQRPKAKTECGERKRKKSLGRFWSWARKEKEESFFKRKSFSIFRALKIDQIQMKFEFNLKQPSPTLNQK